MYKLFNGFIDVNVDNYFRINNYSNPARSSHRVVVTHSATDIRRNFFTQRTTVPWNRFPEHIVTSSTVAEFKRKYDNITNML